VVCCKIDAYSSTKKQRGIEKASFRLQRARPIYIRLAAKHVSLIHKRVV
jgi:hypothetical protein